MTNPTSGEARLRVGDREVVIRVRQNGELHPNPDNANRGRERGNAAVRSSLRETGLHRGIVVAGDDTVIAGNHAYQAALEEGIAKGWIEVELPDGAIGVVTKRCDWRSHRDATAIKSAIYDNRSQELNYALDPVQLAADLDALNRECEAIAPELFTEEELVAQLAAAGSELMDRCGEEGDRAEEDYQFECPNCGHQW